jgi:antitoxin component YwqK of YwqJK toxin-antitoxin module
LEKEEPVIGKTQPRDTDYIDKKDDSAIDYAKKSAIEKAPAKRDRIEKKKADTGREELREKTVSKKGYDAEKPKPELPGTQRQIEVPYPQVPRKEGRSKKAGQKKQIKTQEQRTVPKESETSKNQMAQTDAVQTEGNLQVLQSNEDAISAEKPVLSRVISVHADGSKKVVNNYIQISGKRTLNEIVEYDEKGRIILIKNPQTKVEKKFSYFPDGKKKLQEEYKNGKPHGNWIKWNKKGEILSNRIYKKGKLEKKIKQKKRQ